MKQQWPDNIFLLELDCWEWVAIGMCRGQAIPHEKQKCPAASMHIYAWGICASCTAMLCLSSQTCSASWHLQADGTWQAVAVSHICIAGTTGASRASLMPAAS